MLLAIGKDTKYKLPIYLQNRGASEAIILIMAFALYALTLSHDFTQDDAIVIYDNIYVQQGIEGVSNIFSKDSFSGFFKGEDKSALVTGGRYRPLSLAIFAVIYEFVGPEPLYYHLLAILIYAVVCLTFYKLILFAGATWQPEKRKFFALSATLIFLVHPIHTEVVANVKGLDESLCLLFTLLATVCALISSQKNSYKYLSFMMVFFILAILSKENAVAFLFIIPIVLFSFGSQSNRLRKSILAVAMLTLTFAGYWILRDSIIGSDLSATQTEMLNNPFIKISDGRYIPFTLTERWASIVLGMGKYIQLLFFPHPLTHDYYPRHFGIVNFQNIEVIMSIVMNTTLILIAILGLRKKSFVTFCIIFFYLTIGLMSNVLFPIGTHLSERFLFTPSIAIALLIAYGLVMLLEKGRGKSIPMMIFSTILILGASKTVLRSQVWKNDFTLFTTDVKTSRNSAKVRNAAGGALLDESLKKEGVAREEMVDEAIVHLLKALEIHPNYKEAYLLLGNGYLYKKDFARSINAYSNALKINPYYDQASENLVISLREGAKQAGGVNQNIPLAISYLERALKISPLDFQSTALMGTAYGSSGNHLKAIEYYKKAIELNPEVASTYVNLGLALLNAGMEEEAQSSFNKAAQLDPRALDQIRKSE